MKTAQKRKSHSVSTKRNKPLFKLPKILDDPLLDDEVRDSIKRAFFAKGFTYATSLVYDSPDCPETFNDPSLENVQKLDKEYNDKVYELRKREKAGILPPLKLKYDPNQGFYVEAAIDIQDLTLICEYLGEVRTVR